MQLDRYIYKICIVHIERDELPMSRQAIYMRQRSGPAQFEFNDDQFSRDAVHNGTPTIDFIESIHDLKTGLLRRRVWFPAHSNVTCTGKGVKIDLTNQ